MRRKALIGAITVLTLLASSAGADIIASFDVARADGKTAEAGYTADGITASDLKAHGVNALNPRHNYKGMVAAKGWSKKDYRSPGKYFEFSVSAEDGMAMDFETISMALFRGHGYGGKKHGAQTWELRASGDRFRHEDQHLVTMDISDSDWDTQTRFIDQDISALGSREGEVTFRLYGYNQTNNHDYAGLGNEGGAIDQRYCGVLKGMGSDVVIGGSVASAVPEPATAGVLAVGGLALVIRRKRKATPA